MDFRKKLIVEPGSKVRLKAIDPGFHGKHENEDERQGRARQGRRPPDRAAVPALRREEARAARSCCRASTPPARTAPCWHVMTAMNPQGTTVTGFKQPTEAELAHDFLWRVHPHAPGPRPGRDLQPLALRGRAGRARARAGAEGGLVEALRPDQRLREAARRQRHHHPQVLPATSRPRSSSSASRTASTTRRGSGRSATATTRSARFWDDYVKAYEAMLEQLLDRRTRPGT